MKRKVMPAPKPPDSFASVKSKEIIKKLSKKYDKVMRNLA